MTRHLSNTPSSDIDAIASAWFARKRSGDMTSAEQGELELWLARDPAHREAFAVAEAVWGRIEAVRSDPRVLAMREARSGWRGWRQRNVPRALVASLVVAVALGILALAIEPLQLLFAPPVRHAYHTSVGETRTVTLPDGTVMTLDTDTVVLSEQSRSERLLQLQKGQAFFRVAHDESRRFVVQAGRKRVTAVGTQFAVRVEPSSFAVTLVEGRVRVEVPDASGAPRVQVAEMTAGSQLVLRNDEQWTVTPIDAERATSWMRGLLAYESKPLSVVVADMNRYSNRKITIADQKLAGMPVSGTFRAGDVEQFVRALEAYGMARVRAAGPESVELVAAEK